MRIRNTHVILTGQSNFAIQIFVDNRMSYSQVAAQTRAASTDLKTNLLVLGNFFGKVLGIDRNYPTIFGGGRGVIEVRQPTLEIWAGRALVAYGVYSLLNKAGIL